MGRKTIERIGIENTGLQPFETSKDNHHQLFQVVCPVALALLMLSHLLQNGLVAPGRMRVHARIVLFSKGGVVVAHSVYLQKL